MEPISLILAALLAGTSAGISNVTATAIKGSYDGLRAALKRKLAGEPEAGAAIDGYIDDQDGYEELLRATLLRAGADRDSDIVSKAQAIIAVVDPQALTKFNVRISKSENIQIGDGNVQVNTINRGVK